MSGYWDACSLQISLRLSVHKCNNYDDGDYFLFLVSYLIWCMINHVKENIPPLSEKSQVDYDQIYMTLVFLEHLFHRKKTMNACHLTLILDQLVCLAHFNINYTLKSFCWAKDVLFVWNTISVQFITITFSITLSQ